MSGIEVTGGNPERKISPEVVAEALGAEIIRPMTADGVEIVPGMEVWYWDIDARTAVSSIVKTPGPRKSDFPKPNPGGYVGVRNKSCWSTKEAAIAGHNAQQEELERKFPTP